MSCEKVPESTPLIQHPVEADDKCQHSLSTTTFNFKVFLLEIPIGIFLAVIEGFIMVAFIRLPVIVDVIPAEMLSLVQLSFLVVTVLITYKVLVINEPEVKRALKSFTKGYKNKGGKVPDGAEGAGEVMVS